MRGANAKLARKAANDAAAQTGRQAATGLLGVLEYARKIEVKASGLEAAVSALEAAVGHLEIKARASDAFRLRSFAGRLLWALTGR